MIDLVVIGAVVHFCMLGHHLMKHYGRFVDAYEDFVYHNEDDDEDDDDFHIGFL